MIEDHKADAFNPPSNVNQTVNIYDRFVGFLINGYKRWDAIHFTHIAQYGYIYEHSVAFFPLYPLTINLFASLLQNLLQPINPYLQLNGDTLILVSALSLNLIYFTISTVYLFKLTKLLFNNNSQLAYLTSIIFCVNPATIFFCSPYSESIFSMLTFSSLYYLYTNSYLLSLSLFSLSCAARSNGLVNYIFVLYAIAHHFLSPLMITFNSKNSDFSLLDIFKHIFKQLLKFKTILSLSKSLFYILFSLIFFVGSLFVYQYYIYKQFCFYNYKSYNIPKELIDYGNENLYYLITNGTHKVEWCNNKIPFSYSAIQSKYWNVGFMQYWKFKQIPNFVLALPILYLSIQSLISYLKSIDNRYLFNLFGLININTSSTRNGDLKLFPFMIHLFVLTISSTFFMHVQVNIILFLISNLIHG